MKYYFLENRGESKPLYNLRQLLFLVADFENTGLDNITRAVTALFSLNETVGLFNPIALATDNDKYTRIIWKNDTSYIVVNISARSVWCGTVPVAPKDGETDVVKLLDSVRISRTFPTVKEAISWVIDNYDDYNSCVITTEKRLVRYESCCSTLTFQREVCNCPESRAEIEEFIIGSVSFSKWYISSKPNCYIEPLKIDTIKEWFSEYYFEIECDTTDVPYENLIVGIVSILTKYDKRKGE